MISAFGWLFVLQEEKRREGIGCRWGDGDFSFSFLLTLLPLSTDGKVRQGKVVEV